MDPSRTSAASRRQRVNGLPTAADIQLNAERGQNAFRDHQSLNMAPVMAMKNNVSTTKLRRDWMEQLPEELAADPDQPVPVQKQMRDDRSGKESDSHSWMVLPVRCGLVTARNAAKRWYRG